MSQITRLLSLPLRGKFVTRAITVLLSAFSFALFALASMGYTYNERDFIVRGYENFLERREYPYILFTGLNALGRTYYTPEHIAQIEEETGLSFVRDYDCPIGMDRAGGVYFEELGALSPGDGETIEALGFRFLAGRAPEGLFEIAVSDREFEYFRENGYRDVRKNYRLAKDGKWEDGSPAYLPDVFGEALCEDGYWYIEEPRPVEKIQTPQDLFGKTFPVTGDPERGELGKRDGRILSLFEVKIVGVVDTRYDADEDSFNRYDLPAGRIFVSETWEETFFRMSAARQIFSPASKEHKIIAKCVDVSLALAEYAKRTSGSANDLGLYDFSYLLNEFDLFPNEAEGIEGLLINGRRTDLVWLCGLGGIFAVFGIVLNAYLMTALLERRRKQIGVLRALGGSKKKIALIYLFGALVMGCFIFAAALSMVAGLYFGLLLPNLADSYIGVSRYVLTGWNVLLLAVICIGAPILSSLFPLWRFLRRSCVEMMKDTKQKR